MDKPSERRKDHKEFGDTDVGVHDHKSGGCLAQLDGLWSIPPKEVVGLPPTRILTNDYCKDKPGEKKSKEKPSLLEEIMNNGPPMLNTSKPHRVF